MPAALERKLKSEYGQHSAIPYRIMNSRGLMPHSAPKKPSLGKHKITIVDLMKRK